MAWQLYQVVYELHSPLHIGYHKIGNLQRTRYYIPARNLWAAVTERLTRCGFAEKVLQMRPDDYRAVGDWVREHCAFGYWFVYEGNTPLCPNYERGDLRYGTLSVAEFERRYLSTHVTTALDAATTSAETGSLHEVEFIAPYDRNGGRTRLGGWVLVDDTDKRAQQVLGGDPAKWGSWLGELQVGGERRYGFGRLRLENCNSTASPGWQLDGQRPRLQVTSGKPLQAHTLTQGVDARGQIEVLVWRETTRSDRFGGDLTGSYVCWAPGSVLEAERWFEIQQSGIWQAV